MSTSCSAHLDYAAAALAHFDRAPNGVEAGRRGIIATEALRILLHEPAVNGWTPEADDYARLRTEHVDHVNNQIVEHFRSVDPA